MDEIKYAIESIEEYYEKYSIITFSSPNDALILKAETDDFGLMERILPTPRNLRISCSFCFRTEDTQKLLKLLEVKNQDVIVL